MGFLFVVVVVVDGIIHCGNEGWNEEWGMEGSVWCFRVVGREGSDGDGLRFVVGIFMCAPLFPPTNTFYLGWYLTGYLTRAHVIRRSTGWKVVGFFKPLVYTHDLHCFFSIDCCMYEGDLSIWFVHDWTRLNNALHILSLSKYVVFISGPIFSDSFVLRVICLFWLNRGRLEDFIAANYLNEEVGKLL